jgi:cytochrome c553
MICSRALAAAAAAAALAVGLPLQAAEGDPAAAIQKKQMCEGCHGKEGYRTAYPTVYKAPKLGGQTQSYLVKALQDYRSGARQHPSMNGIAATLSDQDVADLAAYYAGGAK